MAARQIIKKTDNRSLPLKLKVRRWGLEHLASHTPVASGGLPPPLRVLDLCSGEGHIWKALRQEYDVRAYTPCDRKPRLPGCIAGEAERLIESFDLALFNVIDVDVYGSPWEVWLKLAQRIGHTTLVFLTHGIMGNPGGGGGRLSLLECAALGLPLSWIDLIPRKRILNTLAVDYCLAAALEHVNVLVSGRVQTQAGGTTMTHHALLLSPHR